MLKATTNAPPGKRVLFVDDSRLMRYAGSRFLDPQCDLVMAENGEQAWELLNEDRQIALVFTDLMMPVMDGHELIRTIRACRHQRIRQLPVLAVTGSEEANAREKALAAGATAFIPKPFSADDLSGALRIHLHGEIPDPELVMRSGGQQPDHPLFSQLPEPDYYYLRIEQAFAFHVRQSLDLALMHVKLSNHEHLAQRFGQAWARAIMRNLRYFLLRELRQDDSVHQTGEDLYSVILMGTHKAGARALVSRLRRALSGARIRFASQEIELAVRFGIQFPDLVRDDSPAKLLTAAYSLFDFNSQISRIR